MRSFWKGLKAVVTGFNLNGIQEVRGSIPRSSTINYRDLGDCLSPFCLPKIPRAVVNTVVKSDVDKRKGQISPAHHNKACSIRWSNGPFYGGSESKVSGNLSTSSFH